MSKDALRVPLSERAPTLIMLCLSMSCLSGSPGAAQNLPVRKSEVLVSLTLDAPRVFAVMERRLGWALETLSTANASFSEEASEHFRYWRFSPVAARCEEVVGRHLPCIELRLTEGDRLSALQLQVLSKSRPLFDEPLDVMLARDALWVRLGDSKNAASTIASILEQHLLKSRGVAMEVWLRRNIPIASGLFVLDRETPERPSLVISLPFDEFDEEFRSAQFLSRGLIGHDASRLRFQGKNKPWTKRVPGWELGPSSGVLLARPASLTKDGLAITPNLVNLRSHDSKAILLFSLDSPEMIDPFPVAEGDEYANAPN